MPSKTEKKSIIGKFILDSISIGMYNDPLMLFREYIQNSADAIDELYDTNGRVCEESKIEINIDGANRIISIKDNGCGLSSKDAWSTLHDIGRSTKKININRGFRGIGRLGGLAYCDCLKFITKAKGERVYSTSIWDCNNLRKFINEENGLIDARRIVESIVQFSQDEYKKSPEDHFFIVEMYNVKSSRDVLLNVPVVKSYVSQVAPAPFNYSKFRYAEMIDKKVREMVTSYVTYNIYVNGEQIFKPYTNIASIYKNVQDEIKFINFLDLTYDGKYLGFGWIAEIEFLGIIHSSNCVDGLRLRSGNILVGDKNLLSAFFRERRFNNYLIGEVYTVNERLILNSRRDDFEENESKEALYCSFVKDIGLPFSQKIREASESRSKQKNLIKENNLLGIARKIYKNGYISKVQKQNIISELEQIKNKETTKINSERIDDIIDKVANSNHFLEENHKKFSKPVTSMLSSIFDIIFEKCSNKKEAESIINTIIKKIS